MQDAEVSALTVAEVADRLHISHDVIQRLINAGTLRSFKAGGRRLVSNYALTEFVANREFADAKARSERKA